MTLFDVSSISPARKDFIKDSVNLKYVIGQKSDSSVASESLNFGIPYKDEDEVQFANIPKEGVWRFHRVWERGTEDGVSNKGTNLRLPRIDE